jgi:hypothetical protein
LTFRQFDDRIFVPDSDEPAEELAMQAAIGMNKEKNPVVAKMAGKIGLVLHKRFTTLDTN